MLVACMHVSAAWCSGVCSQASRPAGRGQGQGRKGSTWCCACVVETHGVVQLLETSPVPAYDTSLAGGVCQHTCCLVFVAPVSAVCGIRLVCACRACIDMRACLCVFGISITKTSCFGVTAHVSLPWRQSA